MSETRIYEIGFGLRAKAVFELVEAFENEPSEGSIGARDRTLPAIHVALYLPQDERDTDLDERLTHNNGTYIGKPLNRSWGIPDKEGSWRVVTFCFQEETGKKSFDEALRQVSEWCDKLYSLSCEREVRVQKWMSDCPLKPE